MPGVTERQSVLVGTIQPGETKQAQLILSPGKDIKGDFDGELAVECTDQDGNSYSFTLPLRLTVTEPVLTVSSAAGTAEKKQEAKTPVAVWVLAGACGFLLILLLTQGTLLRRKVHMLEEAKL